MVKLANLSTNYGILQPETYTIGATLVDNTPINISIPIDSETGLSAGSVLFGRPIDKNFYVAVFNQAEGFDRVVNGTFADDTDWTKGTGWTIGSGVATATGGISTALEQDALGTYPLVAGQPYAVTFTVTRSAGSITPSLGGTNGTAISTSTTITEVIYAGATQAIAFTGSSFTGTLDNISVVACAGYPTSGSTRVIGRENPEGISLGTSPYTLSIVSNSTASVSCSFYKR